MREISAGPLVVIRTSFDVLQRRRSAYDPTGRLLLHVQRAIVVDRDAKMLVLDSAIGRSDGPEGLRCWRDIGTCICRAALQGCVVEMDIEGRIPERWNLVGPEQ